MLAVRENRYIVLAKDFEKAYKTVIKKDEQEHEFYKWPLSPHHRGQGLLSLPWPLSQNLVLLPLSRIGVFNKYTRLNLFNLFLEVQLLWSIWALNRIPCVPPAFLTDEWVRYMAQVTAWEGSKESVPNVFINLGKWMENEPQTAALYGELKPLFLSPPPFPTGTRPIECGDSCVPHTQRIRDRWPCRVLQSRDE